MASLNAGPEYYVAEERYRNARTDEERLLALHDMLKFVPKHKSAGSVLVEIKTKIAKLRKEMARMQRAKSSKKSSKPSIRRQGSGQLVLMGMANSGKSALLNALTNAKVDSTDIPFETRQVTPAMMEVEKVHIQLLDTPSITLHNKNQIYAYGRNADISIILIDPLYDINEQLDFFKDITFKKMLALPKKSLVPEPVRISSSFLYYDTADKDSLRLLKLAIFRELGLIRIFTRNPKTGETDYDRPFALKRGLTVLELAKEIHKELYTNLKYAKVWGSTKYAGQQVSGSHELKDNDVVEMHMR